MLAHCGQFGTCVEQLCSLRVPPSMALSQRPEKGIRILDEKPPLVDIKDWLLTSSASRATRFFEIARS
jgi:hypothetical protein